jgi:hypothetical protein
MSLTETKPVLKSILVNVIKQIEVTREVIILREGEPVVTVEDRVLLKPGDDLTGEDERVLALAQALWTPEFMADYHWGKLSEERFLENILINEQNEIQADVSTIIYRNNLEVCRIPEKIVVKPGDDLTSLRDQHVKSAAISLHTPKVVAKYRAEMAKRK